MRTIETIRNLLGWTVVDAPWNEYEHALREADDAIRDAAARLGVKVAVSRSETIVVLAVSGPTVVGGALVAAEVRRLTDHLPAAHFSTADKDRIHQIVGALDSLGRTTVGQALDAAFSEVSGLEARNKALGRLREALWKAAAKSAVPLRMVVGTDKYAGVERGLWFEHTSASERPAPAQHRLITHLYVAQLYSV